MTTANTTTELAIIKDPSLKRLAETMLAFDSLSQEVEIDYTKNGYFKGKERVALVPIDFSVPSVQLTTGKDIENPFKRFCQEVREVKITRPANVALWDLDNIKLQNVIEGEEKEIDIEINIDKERKLRRAENLLLRLPEGKHFGLELVAVNGDEETVLFQIDDGNRLVIKSGKNEEESNVSIDFTLNFEDKAWEQISRIDDTFRGVGFRDVINSVRINRSNEEYCIKAVHDDNFPKFIISYETEQDKCEYSSERGVIQDISYTKGELNTKLTQLSSGMSFNLSGGLEDGRHGLINTQKGEILYYINPSIIS